jgi:cell division protein ZapA (FtsZ GTPase activity inhibitor)
MSQMKIQLLGREYKLSYEENEEQLLQEAVSYVDRTMKEIKDKTKLVTAERIAVLSAIMIAMRLLDPSSGVSSNGEHASSDVTEVRRRLNRLLKVIETELVPQEHLFLDSQESQPLEILEPNKTSTQDGQIEIQ